MRNGTSVKIMPKGNIFKNLTTIIVVEDNYDFMYNSLIRPTQARASSQHLGTAWVSTN